MKKHILGLMLFGFIVSAAAITYSYFKYQTSLPVSERKQQPKGEFSSIKQAVLSNSGLFVFQVGCVESPKRMSIFFYKKEKGNTQLIAAEEIELLTSPNCNNSTSLYKHFNWAKEINYAANYYVIAQTSDNGQKFSTNFDESLAVPILFGGNNDGFIID